MRPIEIIEATAYAIVVVLCILLVVIVGEKKAHAHDVWADGSAIPAWVKASCCGPADAHLLNASQIHMLSDGIHIDGIATVVPYERVLPSQDGQIWAFWPVEAGNLTPPIYCFFYSGSI